MQKRELVTARGASVRGLYVRGGLVGPSWRKQKEFVQMPPPRLFLAFSSTFTLAQTLEALFFPFLGQTSDETHERRRTEAVNVKATPMATN